MGAWGSGPFDNDDAADWASDLDESKDPLGFVAETFAALEAEEYVESPDANNAVAAAAWLVSAQPGAPVAASTYAPETAAPTDSAQVRALAPPARAALDRVLGPDSEWLELWQETGEDEAPAGVRELAAFVSTLT